MKETLPASFQGKGEVKGFTFQLIGISENALMYKVSSDGNYHFEVFERRFVPICLDFAAKIFSQTDFKEIYPKAKDFGIWAWTFNDVEQATAKFAKISTVLPQISNDQEGGNGKIPLRTENLLKRI